MAVKFPILILGYTPKKVFSITDADGVAMMPIFQDAERAEKYRRYFARKHQTPLDAYVISEPQKGIEFFQVLASADQELKFFVVDPPLPTDEDQRSLAFEIPQFLQELQERYPGSDKPLHSHKKGGRRRRSQTREGRWRQRRD